MAVGNAIVLFGHGSRDPQWRKPIELIAARVSARSPQTLVRCAYLELDRPDLASAVAELARLGASDVSVVPLFLGVGKHAREDLPPMIEQLRGQYPGLQFNLRPAVGEDDRVLELLATIALE